MFLENCFLPVPKMNSYLKIYGIKYYRSNNHYKKFDGLKNFVLHVELDTFVCMSCLCFTICVICNSARYQQDYDSGMSGSAAERFYQQALMLFPDMGL